MCAKKSKSKASSAKLFKATPEELGKAAVRMAENAARGEFYEKNTLYHFKAGYTCLVSYGSKDKPIDRNLYTGESKT